MALERRAYTGPSSAARYTLVTVVLLCCLSVTLSRPHEKKHKHKHRWHTDRPVVLKDDSKKDIVISDDTHHQELILPKETKQDTNVNLAFDILTPTSIKKGDKSSKKEKTNYNVFLDQEAISFDSSSKHNEVESGNKDVLWHNLYEIKEPDNEVPSISKVVKNKEPLPKVNSVAKPKETTTQNVREPNEGKVQNYNIQTASQIEDSEKDQTSSKIDDSVVSNDNLELDDSDEDEDEDGIDDDYDDYEDYNYFEKDEKESEEENDEKEGQTKEKITQSDKPDVEKNVLSIDSDVKPKSFEDLINEIYGGVLPYSASIESIKEQMKDNHQKRTTHHQVVKKDKAEERVDERVDENLPVVAKKGNAEERVDENEHLPVVAKKGRLDNVNKEKSDVSQSKEDLNVINLNDNKKIVFHQDMLESFDEVEDDDRSKTTAMPTKTSKTAKPLRLSTTAKHPRSSTTTKSPKSSSNQVLAVNSQSEFFKPEKASEKPEPTKTSKINPSFKTPNAAETSPNPPTTKAVAVTAAPVRGVKEFIQSKPLQLCIDDGGCSPGRMCHNGVCVCGDNVLCKSHHTVAVCGSDGQLYPSHCELHRQACIKQVHIRVNRNGECGQNLQEHFEIQPTYQGTHCEYRVFKGQEGILWGDILVPVTVKSLLECSDICDKKSYNGGCFAFQYSDDKNGLCFLFEKPTDIIRHPNSDMDFYEQRRCKPNPDTKCDYEPVNLVADHIYAMCNVQTSFGKSFDECQDSCGNCTAFTYRKDDKICDIHSSKACIDMMNALGIVHYMKRCNEKGDVCHILEVIPGKSPFMCSKATSSVSNLIECHDACIRGRCEAFQYLTKGDKTTCEIFFDKSCIELLDKKKENYYVKRCTNPKDCNYHQIQSASMMPCRVTSSDMDTMEKCLHMCNNDDCYGFMYNYDSLDCSLYSDQSCVLGKNLNYVVRKCHSLQDITQENSGTSKVNQVPTVKEKQISQDKKSEETTKIKSDVQQPKHDVKTTVPPKPTTKAPYSDRPKSLNSLKEHDVVCEHKDYVQFKSDLLRYHCVRFRESNCDQNEIPNKGYIASLMFSYYDRDMNGDIESDELWEMQVAENLEHISTICTLLDILKFEVQDKKLDHTRFLNAFIVADAILKEDLEIISLASTVGNGLEIKCGVEKSDNSEIVWRRNNVDLTTISIPDMAVFSDGTLYFEAVGLHHTGNFTCHDKVKPGVKQIHMLNVNLRPIVRVSPSERTLTVNHIDIFIDCHVDGLPQPHVHWEINNEPMPYKPKHYITTHNNGTLIIHDSNIKRDVGSYKCTATNRAGTSKDIATLDKPGTPEVQKYEAFYVFHKNGYTAYQPENCETIRHVKGDFGNLKYIPEELDRAPSMCGLGQACVWGEAVNVQNKYIYSSQPEQNRVIIIDIVNNFNPVQFVKTDKYPVKLYYVEHLDEVWVLCWNTNHDSGSKTVVVIRDASKDIRHHIVHTQPIGYRFDLVEDIFIPPQNDLDHKFKHGYVIHNKQRGLFKLDLESMRYTKAVDFEGQDCIPKSLAFVPIGGYIIVECQRPVQLIMDYITDTVISNLSIKGTPYVSPDSRNLVFVDLQQGHVTVFSIADNGKIQKLYEVTTGSSVSEVTFFPSDIRTGYDMFLAAADSEAIYPILLDNGQVTTITGKNEARLERVWPWSRTVRTIVNGDMFSQYIAAPTKSTVEILNGRDKRIHCSFEHLDSPDQIVYTSTKL